MSILSDFNDLIQQTDCSLGELDDFDLDSADPISVEEFETLEIDYRKDAKALIEFVSKWRLELLEALVRKSVP